MIYQLDDLLLKMGAPEVREKNHIEWHYFDKARKDLAGFAEVRLEAGGQRLIAELKHTRENYEDDNGDVHATFTESFYLHAVRTGKDRYTVVKVAFDGEEYKDPARNIVELGLGIFHARALDISILMVEQTFNKQDILEPAEAPELHFKKAIFSKLEKAQRESFGVVIPFRPRTAQLSA
jgi:hypothetical protein